ncbi:MAG: hypothetical protein RLO80_11330 [Hyphomonas sp.]
MRLALLAAAAALLITACSPKTETVPAEAPLPLDETSILDEEAPALPPSALDLSKIALAMRVPSGFSADDGADLLINVTNPRLGVNISETFGLDMVEGIESPFLASEAREGFRIWTYTTQVEDAERLTALSLELIRLKTEAPGENELVFSAAAPMCRSDTAAEPGSLSRTIYIRVMPEQDFLILAPEQVLNPGDVPGLERFWEPCTE